MKRFVLIILALLMTLSGCRTPAQTGSGSTGSNEGLNLLIAAEGGVQLKRSGWAKFAQTTFGAMLHKGDLLLPVQGARVVVLCDGLTQWQVPAGAPVGLANGCPPSQAPVLRSGSSLIQSTRGGNDPLIPYIITPRKTRLLDARPYLSWNPSPGASTYTVRLNTDRVIWETTTDQTGLVYPGTPPLQPGVTYLLTVEADNGKTSSSEGAAGLGFSLLGAEEARSVNEASKPAGLPQAAA